MISKFLTHFLAIGLSPFMMNCNNNSCDPDILIKQANPKINKEIPVYKKEPSIGKLDYRFQLQCEETCSLGLNSLINGYDSLQIRIWLGHSMAITNDVVILKYNNQKWSGKLISYSKMEKESGEQYSLIRRQRNLSPISGWESLIINLNKLQLLTLPHDNDLIGYDGCGTDGIRYSFEWATTSKYRMYSYCNPEFNSEKFWQAKNVLQIAELLEREFTFTYIK